MAKVLKNRSYSERFKKLSLFHLEKVKGPFDHNQSLPYMGKNNNKLL